MSEGDNEEPRHHVQIAYMRNLHGQAYQIEYGPLTQISDIKRAIVQNASYPATFGVPIDNIRIVYVGRALGNEEVYANLEPRPCMVAVGGHVVVVTP